MRYSASPSPPDGADGAQGRSGTAAHGGKPFSVPARGAVTAGTARAAAARGRGGSGAFSRCAAGGEGAAGHQSARRARAAVGAGGQVVAEDQFLKILVAGVAMIFVYGHGASSSTLVFVPCFSQRHGRIFSKSGVLSVGQRGRRCLMWLFQNVFLYAKAYLLTSRGNGLRLRRV